MLQLVTLYVFLQLLSFLQLQKLSLNGQHRLLELLPEFIAIGSVTAILYVLHCFVYFEDRPLYLIKRTGDLAPDIVETSVQPCQEMLVILEFLLRLELI